MTVIAFNSEVSKGQLKQYADAVCFSQVGLPDAEISSRLDLPEHLVAAWIASWRDVDGKIVGAVA